MLPCQEQPNKHPSYLVICQRAAVPVREMLRGLKGVKLKLHFIRFPVTAVLTIFSNLLCPPPPVLATLNAAAKDVAGGRRENRGARLPGSPEENHSCTASLLLKISEV